MKLFQDLTLKFENPDWYKNPEFEQLDTIFENHPKLIKFAEDDILEGINYSEFGRGDMSSEEQIFRVSTNKNTMFKGVVRHFIPSPGGPTKFIFNSAESLA